MMLQRWYVMSKTLAELAAWDLGLFVVSVTSSPTQAYNECPVTIIAFLSRLR